jgi:deferrochelatase/peroxidase EfeB
MAQELKRNVKSIAAAYAVGKRTYYKIQGERGLLLAVYATGRRTWLVRYQTGKGERRKERTQVIGDAEHVGIAEACKRRAEIMAEAGRGGGGPAESEDVWRTIPRLARGTCQEAVGDMVG